MSNLPISRTFKYVEIGYLVMAVRAKLGSVLPTCPHLNMACVSGRLDLPLEMNFINIFMK